VTIPVIRRSTAALRLSRADAVVGAILVTPHMRQLSGPVGWLSGCAHVSVAPSPRAAARPCRSTSRRPIRPIPCLKRCSAAVPRCLRCPTCPSTRAPDARRCRRSRSVRGRVVSLGADERPGDQETPPRPIPSEHPVRLAAYRKIRRPLVQAGSAARHVGAALLARRCSIVPIETTKIPDFRGF
jgi:hypothetical protein